MPQHRPRIEPADDDRRMPGPQASPASKRRDDRPPEALDGADRAAVREGLDEMRRGERASDAEVAAVYRRAGL